VNIIEARFTEIININQHDILLKISRLTNNQKKIFELQKERKMLSKFLNNTDVVQRKFYPVNFRALTIAVSNYT